ncbi:hypothetical protein D3C78_1438490 [compost metagenome]
MGDGVLVPLGFEQAVGKAQGNQVLYGFLAQVMVDAIDTVFRKVLRYGIVDPTRRVQVMADGLFQDYAGTRAEPDFVEVFANTAIDRRWGCEVRDQLTVVANLLGQGLIVLYLEEVDMDIAQARQKALQHQRFNLPGWDKFLQVRLD